MALELRNGHTRYYRSRRVGDRIVKEYVAYGEAAVAAAERDAGQRDQLELERLQVHARHQQIKSALTPLDHLSRTTDLLASAALIAAGYNRHNRGPWQRRRKT